MFHEKIAAAALKGIESAADATAKAHSHGKAEAEKAVRVASEMAASGVSLASAMAESGRIWATGMRALVEVGAEQGKAAISEAMDGCRTLATAKSLKEVAEIQAAQARAALVKTAETSKATFEAMSTLAQQAAKPVAAEVEQIVARLPKAA